MPDISEEKRLWRKGFSRVAGLDEAGRGPLAGPVVAAAVVINSKIKNQKSKQRSILLGRVKDSKKLSPKKREELYNLITKNPYIKWGIGVVSEKVIDKINIKNAAELAMEKAAKNLKRKPDYLIIDGNHIQNNRLKTKEHKLIMGADNKVFSCAAASIVAKVSRDRIMLKLHKKYPNFRFDLHKGYPTLLHKRMLVKYGPCDIHRQTFAPVKNMVK